MHPMISRYLAWLREQPAGVRQAQIELAASVIGLASEAKPEPHSLNVVGNGVREPGQPEELRQ